jgi:hypothetical protein
MFLAKFNALGNIVWAKNSSGPGLATGYDMDTYGTNEVYVTGWYDSTFVSFDTSTLVSSGGEDVYIAMYDGNGNLECVKGSTGSLNERCFGVDASINGDITLTGMFESSPVEFGSYSLNNTTSGYQDLFIARLSKPTSNFEIMKNFELNVWPNPSNGIFQINLPEGTIELKIYDIQGREIRRYIASRSIEIQIDTPGMYFLQAKFESTYYAKVLISDKF